MSTKLPPLTDQEMIAMHRGGEPLPDIMAKAFRRNGIGRQRVREIVFGAPR